MKKLVLIGVIAIAALSQPLLGGCSEEESAPSAQIKKADTCEAITFKNLDKDKETRECNSKIARTIAVFDKLDAASYPDAWYLNISEARLDCTVFRAGKQPMLTTAAGKHYAVGAVEEIPGLPSAAEELLLENAREGWWDQIVEAGIIKCGD